MKQIRLLLLTGLVTVLMATARTQGLELKSELASFRFDEFGNIVALTVRGRSVPLQPSPLPISLRVDGKWWHDDLPKVVPIKFQKRFNRLDVTAKVGNFTLTVHYQLHKGYILQK
ncbi:MAG: hypothetical protein ACK40X_14990, partial [Armatimonadota bacterium]